MSLLILGAGYSGKAIAREAADTIHDIAGTTRSPEKAMALAEAGMQPLLFDGRSIGAPLRERLQTVTHLVQSIAPGKDGDPFLALADRDLRTVAPNLRWIACLSTVGVYGDHGGIWVDETTPCRPVSARSVERVAAETAWREAGSGTDVPVAILRLSGIYGPGRNALSNLEKGTARRIVKPGQVFNRIRVEDIGRACVFLMRTQTGGIFNVTDDQPAPPQDVVAEAARLMGIAPPPEQAFDTADLTPMARSFYGENKRVSNALIRSMGFEFLFPDYRQSLEQLWNTQTWRG